LFPEGTCHMAKNRKAAVVSDRPSFLPIILGKRKKRADP